MGCSARGESANTWWASWNRLILHLLRLYRTASLSISLLMYCCTDSGLRAASTEEGKLRPAALHCSRSPSIACPTCYSSAVLSSFFPASIRCISSKPSCSFCSLIIISIHINVAFLSIIQVIIEIVMELAAKPALGTGEAPLGATVGAQNNNSSGDAFLQRESGVEQGALCNQIHKMIKNVLLNLKYQILISVLTIYSLFFDDFRTAFFDPSTDLVFDSIGLAIMVIFMLEIILSCFIIDGYFLSFFFFLDVISTISIIFDVNFLSDIIFSTSNTSSISQLAAQSKASRAATRAVRIVKLVRIIRIIKVYKNAEKAKDIKEKAKRKQILKEKMLKKKHINESSAKEPASFAQQSQSVMLHDKKTESHQIYPQENVRVEEEMRVEDANHIVETNQQINDQQLQTALNKESKIGKILSELSIRKVIIVILLLMFVIPLFSIDVYRDPENVWDYTLKNENEVLQLSTSVLPTSLLISQINNTIAKYYSETNYIIQYSSPFNELPYYSSLDLSSLRSSDLISSVQEINVTVVMLARPQLTLRSDLTAKQSNSLTAILDQSEYNKVTAYFSLSKTLFVCLVLILLLQLFANDINTLLVEPIEGMMEKLMLMAKDPESAAKEELNTNTQLETTVISNAIIKIGALLSIVFGSAGAEIIGSNIIQEGDMNPMIEGKKKAAIFGFCDIRHFTEVTQVLQEEILIFVNKIGSLVHESVYRYGGCANKNIGQAFLLVWKIPEAKYTLDYQTNAIEWKDRRYLSVLADFSVLGFVKTLIKIHKDPLVLEYGLDSRLKEKMPDFTVSMGFGLHVGWAIEGAIGSEYKIDASYLSPNVNMASRLQAATKQFGVDFLVSEDLYELLTADMKSYFRNIDRVTVKGSEKPIKLYTIDLSYDRITPPARKDLKYLSPADMPDSENKRAINLEFLKDEEIEQYNAKKFIMGKKELRQVLHHNLPIDFKKRFQLGVNCYLKGKWGDSRLHLCEALKHKLNDGPSKTLLNFMKKHNFVSPSNWKQYRPLTSK